MVKEQESKKTPPPKPVTVEPFSALNPDLSGITPESLQELAIHRILLYIFYGYFITSTFNKDFLESLANIQYRTHYPNKAWSVYLMIQTWPNIVILIFLTISNYKRWFKPGHILWFVQLFYFFIISVITTFLNLGRGYDDLKSPLLLNSTNSEQIERFCGFKFGISEAYNPRSSSQSQLNIKVVYWLYQLISYGMIIGCAYSSSRVYGKMTKQRNLDKKSVKNCLSEKQIDRLCFYLSCWSIKKSF